MFNREPSSEPGPTEWRWDGSRARTVEMWTHCRDAAGLLYFQGPNRFERAREDGYIPARLRVPVEGEAQGESWEPIPLGALVRKAGTAEEPVFSIITPKDTAAVFDG